MAAVNETSQGETRAMENDGEYLFRGTTVGFAGSVFPRVRLTSASADPVVATLFATTASRYGQGVVYIIPVAKFSARVHDNRQSDRLAALEAEFVIESSPSEIATCSVPLPVVVARSILERMGVTFPVNIYNLPDLSDAIRLTKRLSSEEILVFIHAAEESTC